MRKSEWKKSYRGKIPHWAVSLEPSKFAQEFAGVLKQQRILQGKLLEIGCGNGRDSFFLAQKGFKMTAIDIAPKAIALCKRNSKGPEVDFLVADAERMPFKSDSFAGVFSIGVLHTTKLEKSLKELARILERGGLAFAHIFEKTVYLSSGKTKRHCSQKKIKNILENLPFRILSFEAGFSRTEPDFDKEEGPHKHFGLVVILQKI